MPSWRPFRLGDHSSSLLADVTFGTLDPSDSAELPYSRPRSTQSIEVDTQKRRSLLIGKVGWRHVKPFSPIPVSSNSFEIGFPVYVLALLLREIHTTEAPIKISGAIYNT